MRGWLRRLAVVLAFLALVALGARVIVGASTRTRLEVARQAFEEERGARLPADLAPAPVPAGENVAPALLTLVDDLRAGDPGWKESANRVTQFHGRPPERWSDEEWRTAARFAATCGPIERYEDLASRSASDFEIDYSQGWSTPLPPFIDILGVARCALMHGRLGLAEGDAGRFLTGYRALGNVARGLANEPMLISQLMAIAVDRHRHHLLQPVLERGRLDSATLDALLEIEEGRPLREGIATALEAEALMIASTPSRVIVRGVMAEDDPSVWSFERAYDYLMEPSGDLARLAALENRGREIASLDRTAIDIFRSLDDGTFYDAEHQLRDQLAPNIEDVLLKAYAADTVDALARSALEVARQVAAGRSELMTTARTEPMSGAPLAWRATETHLVASAPDAAAIWDERASFAGSLPPLFEWPVALELSD